MVYFLESLIKIYDFCFRLLASLIDRFLILHNTRNMAEWPKRNYPRPERRTLRWTWITSSRLDSWRRSSMSWETPRFSSTSRIRRLRSWRPSWWTGPRPWSGTISGMDLCVSSGSSAFSRWSKQRFQDGWKIYKIRLQRYRDEKIIIQSDSSVRSL